VQQVQVFIPAPLPPVAGEASHTTENLIFSS
jgi:hypothetical protein